jgi:predicted MFS family arabinose efflux permease
MSGLAGHGEAEAARQAMARQAGTSERGPSRALPRQAPQAGQLSPGLVRLMAVTCAVTVANLYYGQPLLHTIAQSLHVSQGSASLLVTAGQAGYAVGLLLIVPAGDIMRRRPLLTGLLAICSLTLAGCALAPAFPVLALAAALAAVTSVVVQMLVPYAATLASDAERGKVIGTLMGGLLIGILLSRTFAGVVAGLAGWRAVYGAAAVMMAVTTIALRAALPDHGPQLSISYAAQLRGVLDIARAEPALRWRSLIAASGFGSFACFWTTVTFLLAGPQYGFTQLQIGLFALVGAAGAATAMASGRILDARPGLRWPVTGALLALLAASYILIGLGGTRLPLPGGGWSLALLVIGVLVMDACVQGSHVTNQAVIYDLLPQARSRLTTVYITTMFAGGAVGSAAGAQAYQHWGWTGATLTAAAFPVAGLACWMAVRRHEAAGGQPRRQGVGR